MHMGLRPLQGWKIIQYMQQVSGPAGSPPPTKATYVCTKTKAASPLGQGHIKCYGNTNWMRAIKEAHLATGNRISPLRINMEPFLEIFQDPLNQKGALSTWKLLDFQLIFIWRLLWGQLFGHQNKCIPWNLNKQKEQPRQSLIRSPPGCPPLGLSLQSQRSPRTGLRWHLWTPSRQYLEDETGRTPS